MVWNKPDIENFVPLWIIILAILAGLLLLAVLIYVLYRVSVEKQNDLGFKKNNLLLTLCSHPMFVFSLQLGFFKRSGPYGTAMEKAQLKPQAASEA